MNEGVFPADNPQQDAVNPAKDKHERGFIRGVAIPNGRPRVDLRE